MPWVHPESRLGNESAKGIGVLDWMEGLFAFLVTRWAGPGREDRGPSWPAMLFPQEQGGELGMFSDVWPPYT